MASELRSPWSLRFPSWRSRDGAWTARVVIALAYVVARVIAFAGTAPSRAQDSLSYLEVAKLDPLSAGFLGGPRAWVTPLFYKVFGGHSLAIDVQFALSVVCWLALAAAAVGLVRSQALKTGVFATVLVLSLTPQVAGWDSLLLSDSLSLSLGAAVVAAWLVFVRAPGVGIAIAVVALSLLWAFTRDTNAYLVLLTGVAALLATPVVRRRVLSAGIGIALVVVFVLALISINAGATGDQAQSVFGGRPQGDASFGRSRLAYENPAQQDFLFSHGRWQFPTLNVVGVRVLTDQDRLNYFRAHGMPVPPALLALKGGTAASHGNAFYVSPKLARFRRWLYAKAQSTYANYLLSHPIYSLRPLVKKSAIRAMLFSPTSLPSDGVPLERQKPIDAVDSVLPGPFQKLFFSSSAVDIALWAIAVLLAVVLVVMRRPSRAWVVPAVLLALTVPHFLLVWHGDPQDPLRHGLDVAVLFRLGVILFVFAGLDSPRRMPVGTRAQEPTT